jgi:hypothetical protein
MATYPHTAMGIRTIKIPPKMSLIRIDEKFMPTFLVLSDSP